MELKNLDAVLEQYIRRFDELNALDGNDEGYKWRAESLFKRNWDIDAQDFAVMFVESIGKIDKLIDNGRIQPIGGIQLLLEQETEIEFVRSCFRELFSEDGGDLQKRQNRINIFIDKINECIEKYAPVSSKYKQKSNDVIYYLNLWKPDENYIFKSTIANNWAKCIEYGDDFGSGASFSLGKYYKMCDELLLELKKKDEILGLNAKRVEKEAQGFDDMLHIFVYDIMYCANTYHFYKNVDIKKMTKKERISKAAYLAKMDSINDKLEAKLLQFENIDELRPIPAIVGETVSNKTYGTGTIISITNGIMNIKFSECEKKFVYPDAFINGFIFTDKENFMEPLKRNAALKSNKKKLKKEIVHLKKASQEIEQ